MPVRVMSTSVTTPPTPLTDTELGVAAPLSGMLIVALLPGVDTAALAGGVAAEPTASDAPTSRATGLQSRIGPGSPFPTDWSACWLESNLTMRTMVHLGYRADGPDVPRPPGRSCLSARRVEKREG